VLRHFGTPTVILALLCANYPAVGRENPEGLESNVFAPAIVIGFVGGLVRHNNDVHSEVQLATRLRNAYPSSVHVIMFENRRGVQARREIMRLLDVNHDGTLSPGEKLDARIAIYGHSWGASETVTLARALGKEGIPVLLTIQVDSIAKLGENDESIPANVAQAVNFYQRRGLLQGRQRIRAADASRTQILGNFQFDYKTNTVNCEGYPWYARFFMRPHLEIESDPSVWRQVERLIRSKLDPPVARGTT
jgi:hypothetical protein